MSCIVCKCWNCTNPNCLLEFSRMEEYAKEQSKKYQIEQAKKFLEENGYLVSLKDNSPIYVPGWTADDIEIG